MNVIQWTPGANAPRLSITTPEATTPTDLSLTAPFTLGFKRMIQIFSDASSQQINRQMTLMDSSGRVLATTNGQFDKLQVVVGPTIMSTGWMRTVLFYGLSAGDTYTVRLENKNPDGSPSWVDGRGPLNVNIESMNVV